jgi:uncharacterized protein YjiS (DUF1127 family)
MAYAHSNTAHHGSILARFTRVFAEVKDAARRMALYNQTRRELAGLSDRDLADLGIHRSMIADVAHRAAYQK